MSSKTLQVQSPSNPTRPSLWHRAEDALSTTYRPVLRVSGVVLGVMAFGAAAMAAFAGLDAGLLAASGGLGALAFGITGVLGQLTERDATLRKAKALARLARRSLVEMTNRCDGIIMATWIGEIGTSASLDPVEKVLRELIDLTASLGGWRADSAERAFFFFLKAADHINVLFARIPSGLGDFAKGDLTRKGKTLGALIAAIASLASIAPFDPEEPQLNPKVEAQAETLEKWYGEFPL